MASLRCAMFPVYVVLLLATLSAAKAPKKCQAMGEIIQGLLYEVKNDLRELREEINCKRKGNETISVRGI